MTYTKSEFRILDRLTPEERGNIRPFSAVMGQYDRCPLAQAVGVAIDPFMVAWLLAVRQGATTPVSDADVRMAKDFISWWDGETSDFAKTPQQQRIRREELFKYLEIREVSNA